MRSCFEFSFLVDCGFGLEGLQSPFLDPLSLLPGVGLVYGGKGPAIGHLEHFISLIQVLQKSCPSWRKSLTTTTSLVELWGKQQQEFFSELRC
jgi:hypothetical protein